MAMALIKTCLCDI